MADVINNSKISPILSETGNVAYLPVNPDLQIGEFDFYRLNEEPSHLRELIGLIESSNAILVPSRRVLYNFQDNPIISRYYRLLFDGQLGFEELRVVDRPSSLGLNPESAEETYSVFDHPRLRIYRKVTPLNYSELLRLFQDSEHSDTQIGEETIRISHLVRKADHLTPIVRSRVIGLKVYEVQS
jgi:hypothetical protein